MPKLGGFISVGAVMKCLFSSLRTWTNNTVCSNRYCSQACICKVGPSM